MPNFSDDLFYTYKTGKLTVVGFDGRHLAHEDPDLCLRGLMDLVATHDCKVLVVDLMDIPVIHSWILGILAALRSRGVRVELYHPSAQMREVLDVTHLDKVLHVRDP